MNPHDDERDPDLETVQRAHARLPHEVPSVSVDAAIRAAAERELPRQRARRWRAWGTAAGAAACIALAVILLPKLLINVPAPAREMSETGLVVKVRSDDKPAPAADAVSRETRRQAAREAPAQLREEYTEGRGEPASPVAPALEAAPQARSPSRSTNDPRLVAARAALADADEATWREQILFLRARGDDALAAGLLEKFRERFDKPEKYSLDDLAADDTHE